jgi:hypothetical protein
MANPYLHAKSSAKKFGGLFTDYLEIHKKMDCSKAYLSSNIHRTLTHHPFWIHEVMIPIFGDIIQNSEGKIVSVKDICEQHILEDFGGKYIPTAQDYFENVELKDWLNNGLGGEPQSVRSIKKQFKNLD